MHFPLFLEGKSHRGCFTTCLWISVQLFTPQNIATIITITHRLLNQNQQRWKWSKHMSQLGTIPAGTCEQIMQSLKASHNVIALYPFFHMSEMVLLFAHPMSTHIQAVLYGDGSLMVPWWWVMEIVIPWMHAEFQVKNYFKGINCFSYTSLPPVFWVVDHFTVMNRQSLYKFTIENEEFVWMEGESLNRNEYEGLLGKITIWRNTKTKLKAYKTIFSAQRFTFFLRRLWRFEFSLLIIASLFERE